MSDPQVVSPNNRAPRGWVLKITRAWKGYDRLKDALETNNIVIGWSYNNFTELEHWENFTSAIHGSEFGQTNQSVGQQAGSIWRFVREMQPGDLVAVPDGVSVYVAKITGNAFYDQAKSGDFDAAHRRSCSWFNSKRPFRRDDASATLWGCLKARQTCVSTDMEAIRDLVMSADAAVRATPGALTPRVPHRFIADMQKALLEALRSPQSHLNDWHAEALIAGLFRRMGATHADIPPRRNDVGADVVATFGQLGIKIVAQVKYHRDPEWKTGEDGLEALLNGMDAENADIGWLITWGQFAFDTEAKREKLSEENRNVRFIEGPELARLFLETGVANGTADRALGG